MTVDLSRKRGELGHRLLVRSFLSLVLVGSVVVALQSWLVLQQKRKQQYEAVVRTVELLLPNVASASWQVSESTLRTLLRSMAAMEGVTAVRFDDGALDLVEQSRRQAPNVSPDWGRCDHLIRHDLRGYSLGSNALPSGLLEVCYASPELSPSQTSDALVAALPLLALILLASAYPAWLVGRVVIRPINQLTAAIRSSSLLRFDPDRASADRGDELDELIAELKERTQRLYLEQGVADLAFQSLVEGMALVDDKGVLQRVNNAMCRMLQVSRETLVGARLSAHLPEAAFQRGSGATEFELAGGRVLEATWSDLRGVGARGIQVVLLRDLTEKKNLKTLVHQAHKMNALGTLSSGVAHDFNNLLMAIGGNAELLTESDRLNEEDREMIGSIRVAVRRGATLTSQLLSFARKQYLKKRPVRVGRAVDEVVLLARRTLGSAHRVVVEQTFDGDVITDPTFLEVALLNLLVNARDAQPDGGTIRIQVAQAQGTPQPMIEISIANAGPAIPPEVLARMGEPFFTTKALGKGTGLGLPMVIGFVQQTGGLFDIRSSDGETCISMKLPLADEPVSGEAVDADSPAEGFDSTSKRVLLVDDDRSVRETLTRMIGHCGHEVTALRSLDEVRRHWSAGERWDKVLCDVMLERHSGIDVHGFLRQEGATADFCFVSGNVPDALVERLNQIEDAAFLGKPLSSDELRQWLARSSPVQDRRS